MLILVRKVEQAIVIGDERVIVRVLNIGRNWVSLGVEAPANVTVLREELLEGGK